MIIIIGCFAQSLAGEAHAVNIIAVIIVWRGIVRNSFFSWSKFRLIDFSPLRIDGHWNRWRLPVICSHRVRVLCD